MDPLALRVIRQEHMALSAMLRSLARMVTSLHDSKAPPPFDLWRAMLFYIDEFPERLHHPKESRLLFPKIRERDPALVAVIDQLEADHVHGEAAVRELQHRLVAFELLGESRRAQFETAVERFVEGYMRHMSTEESQVLPAASRCLTAEDWKEVDAAFAANRDPLTGHAPDDRYAPLFNRILKDAPAPFGLG